MVTPNGMWRPMDKWPYRGSGCSYTRKRCEGISLVHLNVSRSQSEEARSGTCGRKQSHHAGAPDQLSGELTPHLQGCWGSREMKSWSLQHSSWSASRVRGSEAQRTWSDSYEVLSAVYVFDLCQGGCRKDSSETRVWVGGHSIWQRLLGVIIIVDWMSRILIPSEQLDWRKILSVITVSSLK